MTQNKFKCLIIGASGYTGAELVRLMQFHPNFHIEYLVADRNAGKDIGTIYPHLSTFNLPTLVTLEEVNFSDVDVAFSCLPHGASAKIISKLPKNIIIIDLSADFRLSSHNIYKEWYGEEHHAPDLQKEVIYGLTELYRDEIKNARIIANPGCYPTSCLLPLSPLLKNSLIDPSFINIDAKSGTSGAGRSEKLANLYCEVNESVKAYNICKHRHIPEIEQTLSLFAKENVNVNFNPHLIPMNRGIISTICVKLANGRIVEDLYNALQQSYKNEFFVKILDFGFYPATKDVFGTNYCKIGLTHGRIKNTAIIVSVIDNLVKGASGQAIQNANLIFGLDEKTGLEFVPVFP